MDFRECQEAIITGNSSSPLETIFVLYYSSPVPFKGWEKFYLACNNGIK